MRLLGKSVTLVMQEAHPMERHFGPVAGQFVRDLLTEHGIEILAEADVAEFAGEGDGDAPVTAVVCADGRRADADLVVAGVGATPDVMLAKKAKLELGETGGVACDQLAAHLGRGDLRRRRHVRVRQRRARPAPAHRARGGRRRAGPPRGARDARLRRAVHGDPVLLVRSRRLGDARVRRPGAGVGRGDRARRPGERGVQRLLRARGPRRGRARGRARRRPRRRRAS